MTRSLRQLILGSLFMALGLVVPMLFHGLGLGPMLMPMFWPLALAGYWLSPALAAVVGLLTPSLSALVTGMPPIPMVWRMMAELAVLPALTAWLYRKTTGSAWIITPLSLVVSLAVGLTLAAVLAPLLGWPARLYALAGLLRSLPGLVIISVVIPLLQGRLARTPFFRKDRHEPNS